jgi:predicted ATP-dependent endonuclease of OLD family
VFLVESELHHQNAILLLDEPGVTLHPLAQKDLFQFFENLGQNNQMIYTTHSPFMVDSNHLERVRSVYIDLQGKTVVSPDLRAAERLRGSNQPQSIYPAHAALGLSVSDTLLINCNPVLVEGESDQVYLSALKNLLISKGKIAPLKEIVFIPTGGVKGIKATSAILSGASEIKPPVLLDGDKPGTKMATELKSDFYAANQDKIIVISEYTALQDGEVEDLFPKQKFARIVAKFLPRPEEVDEEFDDVVAADKPICNQIEDFAKTHNISLEKGWKVRLAITIKREILKGTGKVLAENDPEFDKIIALFKKL